MKKTSLPRISLSSLARLTHLAARLVGKTVHKKNRN